MLNMVSHNSIQFKLTGFNFNLVIALVRFRTTSLNQILTECAAFEKTMLLHVETFPSIFHFYVDGTFYLTVLKFNQLSVRTRNGKIGVAGFSLQDSAHP